MSNIQAQKDEREKRCTEFFLEWYNRSNETNHTINGRPQSIYRGLAKNWDWVCRDISGGKPELAIEVTELGEAEEVQAATRAIQDFKFDLKCRLATIKGEFSLFLTVPGFSKDVQKRAELIELLMAAIQRYSPTMRAGENRELGEDRCILSALISAQCKQFRERLHDLRDYYQQFGCDDIFHEIGCRIEKLNDNGSSISFGSSFGRAFPVPEGKIPEKNRQLQIAKSTVKHVVTILLLDCRRSFHDFRNVEGGIRLLRQEDYSAIDRIYFVNMDKQEIKEVSLPRANRGKNT